jgi:hypothetical protein
MKNLSREELKKISGGLRDAPNCNTGTTCSVVTVNDWGQPTGTQTGNCQMTTKGNSVTCYCDAGGTSNSNSGGLSHCWG